MKTKYYHTSGTRYKPGDIIGGPGKSVFMTTQSVPHYTIHEIVNGGFSSWKEFKKEYEKKRAEYDTKYDGVSYCDRPPFVDPVNPKPIQVFVYEVKPFSKPGTGTWDELIAVDTFVEIVKMVGNAKGILTNFHNKFEKNSSKAFHFACKAIIKNK